MSNIFSLAGLLRLEIIITGILFNLGELLSQFGEVDIVINGKKAIEAFKLAQNGNRPYDLVTLDIMMPELDGHDALKAIRREEVKMGIDRQDGVKVIMVSSLRHNEHVLRAFREGCESYLVKPISKQNLTKKLNTLGLIDCSKLSDHELGE